MPQKNDWIGLTQKRRRHATFMAQIITAGCLSGYARVLNKKNNLRFATLARLPSRPGFKLGRLIDIAMDNFHLIVCFLNVIKNGTGDGHRPMPASGAADGNG